MISRRNASVAKQMTSRVQNAERAAELRRQRSLNARRPNDNSPVLIARRPGSRASPRLGGSYLPACSCSVLPLANLVHVLLPQAHTLRRGRWRPLAALANLSVLGRPVFSVARAILGGVASPGSAVYAAVLAIGSALLLYRTGMTGPTHPADLGRLPACS